MDVLGLDIGGSGIKGLPVNTQTGEPLAERFRLETPQPATPENMVDAILAVTNHFNWNGPIGCGFPAVVKHGVIHTAANIDKSWIGRNAAELIGLVTKCSPVFVANDADAAGIAEMRYGAGRGQQGLVIMITLGTGIGTAMFVDGKLVPNSELGHLLMGQHEAEYLAAESAKKREELDWKTWGTRVSGYLNELARLLWPDLFIIGGGGSKKFDKLEEHLHVRVPVVPAEMRNLAGIIGAAMIAREAIASGTPPDSDRVALSP